MKAAQAYAAEGWSVIPLRPRDKRPLVPWERFQKERATEKQIVGWWKQHPAAGVGIITGRVSGIAVVDVDDVDALKTLRDHVGRFVTRTHKTARGYHFVFRLNGTVPKSGPLLPGIDIKGEGGYVVAPPSVHPSGVPYRLAVSADLMEFPHALIELQNRPKQTGSAQIQNAPDWVSNLLANGSKQGTRNTDATRLAGYFHSKGHPADVIETIFKPYAERCDPPLQAAELRSVIDSVSRYPVEAERPGKVAEELSDAADWPAPEPLPAELSPVPVMIPEMLPAGLRPWVADIADRMSCPLEFPAVAAIVALASAIGRRVQIQPKRADDWTVTPNLWGGVVGHPGVLKSPAIAEVLRPLQALETDAANANEEAARDFDHKKIVTKVQRELIEKKIKKAIENGEPPPERAASDDQETKPGEKRFIVNDSTVEKLGVILNENPHGVVLFRDELTGWLRTLERDGHEGDRDFYKEAWEGQSGFTYDRIGRGTIRITSACVSVFGSIQPGPLGQYLRDAVKGGEGDDGLVQRFQMLVYPDTVAWANVDRKPNQEARKQAENLFRSLAVDRDEPVMLRFHLQAQDFFDTWRADLEARLRREDEHPAMAAHLSKYRSLMPSLALIFHLADSGGVVESPVTLGAAELAAAWCDFLEAHARRVYGSVVHGNRHAAHLLAAKLKKDDGTGLPDPFSVRNVYLKGWTGLTDRDEVRGGLDVLEELGWVRSERIEHDAGGRGTVVYHINPRIRAAA